MYLVISYKYTDYKIYKYTQELWEINTQLFEKIEYAKEILEYKSTKAYKNKILKSEQVLRNNWEEVIFLITEWKYNTYTQESNSIDSPVPISQDLLNQESLISTMTIPQKWIYFILNKDVR